MPANDDFFSDLVAEVSRKKKKSAETIPTNSINPLPNQPRRYFDADQLEALANSISEQGLLQPLLVMLRPDGSYYLIAGERRLRAAKMAGLEEVPVYVFQGSEEEAYLAALAENLSRADLNPYERAAGIVKILTGRLGLDEEEVLARIRTMSNALRKGKSDHPSLHDDVGQQIQNALKAVGYSLRSFAEVDVPVLRLPAEVRELLQSGKVPFGTAMIIARAREEERPELIDLALAGASRGEINNRLRAMRSKKPAAASEHVKRLRKITSALKKRQDPLPKEVEDLLERLERALGLG